MLKVLEIVLGAGSTIVHKLDKVPVVIQCISAHFWKNNEQSVILQSNELIKQKSRMTARNQ